MSARDFGLMVLVCLFWGANLPLTRWLTSDIPPLFVVTLRFAGVALVLSPWLRELPPRPLRTAAVGLCMGGLQFALQYAGVATSSASAAAVVAQVAIPVTVLLSVLVLGERVGSRRGWGIAAAAAGVALVGYDPARFGLSPGLLLVACSAVSVAVGTVLMKGLEIEPLRLQAWAGLVSVVLVGICSALLERGQFGRLSAAGPGIWAGILYSILLASIGGQAIYYGVVRRNGLSAVAPLTLMTPVWAVLIGVVMLGERLEARAALGAALTLAGVLVVLTAGRGRTAPLPETPAS